MLVALPGSWVRTYDDTFSRVAPSGATLEDWKADTTTPLLRLGLEHIVAV
jgi:hypothetical protein